MLQNQFKQQDKVTCKVISRSVDCANKGMNMVTKKTEVDCVV